MAGTATVTEHKEKSIKLIKYAWTSDASGDVSQASTSKFDGEILAIATVPDGSAAPTDNYDITLTDENSLDVLAGQGANRDTANTEYVTAKENLGVVHDSLLTLVVANAGNAKQGTFYVWIR